MTDEDKARIAAGMAAAKDNPNRAVTAYSAADKEHEQRHIADQRRRLDRREADAASGVVVGGDAA
jgi:hypothetical protein